LRRNKQTGKRDGVLFRVLSHGKDDQLHVRDDAFRYLTTYDSVIIASRDQAVKRSRIRQDMEMSWFLLASFDSWSAQPA
jgi:hypothetical protein